MVLIVLDDVGFAQLGCYGSDIETPFIDAVAAEGVRLTISTPRPCARRRGPAC